MNRILTTLAITIIILTAACANPADRKEKQEKATAIPQTAPAEQTVSQTSHRMTPVVQAIQKIDESVVNIRTEKLIKKQSPFFGDNALTDNFLNDFFGFNRTYKTQSLGSGVVIKEDGTIVTNYHVVKGATKVIVMFTDEKTYEAEYLGGDEILDIAVLKIKDAENIKFQAAVTGDSDDIMMGETVIAMGNPYGLSSSITTGIISSNNRVINIGNGYSVFIQTDALINPGNSGGPLVNLDGEVIGINTAIFKEAQGIGFSIPVNTILRILPEIMKNGRVRMGYMGFTVHEDKTSEGTRLTVTRVERQSNANFIGIEVGDQILQVAGIPVASLQAMSNMLRSYPPGSSVAVAIKRGNKTLQGKIAISDYPDNYGLTILKNIYGLTFEKTDKFVTITSSTKDDFFKTGDILIAIENNEIKSLEELNKLIVENLGEVSVLSIYRGGNLIRVKLPL
ncbi:HtrA2 peptidase [Denitrovibrio acetiphilus DSM 12809]|uniref:HtrA2 peptidase n=1 Tax=Denitrovibrio acetiphilus (strain DSM 12809 / NBRC 114555 / N2460) TaxID=522772 RepID=D4H7R4_DENA2|nr:trypsin-like peptidase domain-containing protein [Denitrovibrio acetiphilus]ADD68063.1 HtrA2 peptidase [Denitrovibrio acetiphilus DSM 12809]